MVDVLGLIQSAVAPFLENKIIVYLIVLLILGADTWVAYNFTITPELAAPLKSLDAGEYFVIQNYNDVSGNKMCNKTDGSFFFLEGILFHKATSEEINLYCREQNAQCKLENVSSVGQALGCSLVDPTQKVQHGVFGDMISAPIQFVGASANIDFLKTMQIYSWELLIAMLVIPLFMFVLIASTQAH